MEQRKHERNKRYGWLITFTILNWIAIIVAIVFIDPEAIKNFIIPGSYLPMTILILGGIFWLFSIILLSAVRALRWAIVLVIFLYLRIYGLGTLINGLLILGLLVSWEVYDYNKKEKPKHISDKSVL